LILLNYLLTNTHSLSLTLDQVQNQITLNISLKSVQVILPAVTDTQKA